MSILLPGAIGLILSTALVSCRPGERQPAPADPPPSKEEVVRTLTERPIPTAFEVTQMLNRAGASYILSLNNPVENVDRYITEKSKALNLGIYGANLAYASTYQMTQETMSYLKVTRRLIDELQITTAFNAEMVQRIEENLDNKDTLISIITHALYETYAFLNNEGKDNLALLVMAGGWIEGLYITCQIAVTTKDNAEFLSIVAEQKQPLNELMRLLQAAAHDEMVRGVIEMLTPLHQAFQPVGEVITPAQFERINRLIAGIRASIV